VVDYLKLTRKEIRALQCDGTKYLSPRSALGFVATSVAGNTSLSQLTALLPARDTALGFQVFTEALEQASRRRRSKPRRWRFALATVAGVTIALAGLANLGANASPSQKAQITSHEPGPKSSFTKQGPSEVSVRRLPRGAIVLGGLARAEVNGEARLYLKQRRAWELLAN
jgi:hypothetical protein